MKNFILFFIVLSLLFSVRISAQTVLFSDDFENNYKNWSTVDVLGADFWHISGDDGIGGSKCARFSTNMEKPYAKNDDWLVSKSVNCSAITNVAVSFSYWFHGDGVIPEFYYTNSFDGDINHSSWTKLDNSFWKNEWTWNNARIEFKNFGEQVFFAVRYQSTNNNASYVLLDNFEIKSFVPVVFEKAGSSEHFEFYTHMGDSLNFWQGLAPKLEEKFRHYSSLWNRPLSNDYISAIQKVKVYYTEKENIPVNIGDVPAWKRCFADKDNMTIYLSPLKTKEQAFYYKSISCLAVNAYSQLALSCKTNFNPADHSYAYFFEGFGLYESGFRANIDSTKSALSDLSGSATIDDINAAVAMFQGRKTDLMVTYIESQVLGESYQGIGAGNENLWRDHLKYFYQAEEEKRIGLYKSTANFDIYCIPRDQKYLEPMASKLEELLVRFTSLFKLTINNRFSVVIYPDEQTGMEFTDREGLFYNGGTATGGDNFNVLSPEHMENSMDAAAGGLISHEFFHVIHYHMRPYNGFVNGYFHMEGMADYMIEGTHDLSTLHDLWKIDDLFHKYHKKYMRDPSLNEIMSNPQEIEPYFFGQAFYNYLIPAVASYIDVKNFFCSRCDWGAYPVPYEEIEAGYINYLKRLASLVPPDSLKDIPFKEPFVNFINGWSKPNYLTESNWFIETNGDADGGPCAKFYHHVSDINASDAWLISPPLNAKDLNKAVISFVYARYGATVGLEVLFSGKFDGKINSSDWTSIKEMSFQNDKYWHSSDELSIASPPDTLFVGFHFKSSNEEHLQLLIDNFSVKTFSSGINDYNDCNDFLFYRDAGSYYLKYTGKVADNIDVKIFQADGKLLTHFRKMMFPSSTVKVSPAGSMYFGVLRAASKNQVITEKILFTGNQKSN